MNDIYRKENPIIYFRMFLKKLSNLLFTQYIVSIDVVRGDEM